MEVNKQFKIIEQTDAAPRYMSVVDLPAFGCWIGLANGTLLTCAITGGSDYDFDYDDDGNINWSEVMDASEDFVIAVNGALGTDFHVEHFRRRP